MGGVCSHPDTDAGPEDDLSIAHKPPAGSAGKQGGRAPPSSSTSSSAGTHVRNGASKPGESQARVRPALNMQHVSVAAPGSAPPTPSMAGAATSSSSATPTQSVSGTPKATAAQSSSSSATAAQTLEVQSRLKDKEKAGHSGPPEVRKARIKISEENYQMRRKWPLPKTVPVTRAECDSWQRERRPPSTGQALISFSGMSTATALLHFASKDLKSPFKVCGLNFASGTQVGGGYKTGALAQEEDLCRRLPNVYSSLYNAQRDGLYPFGPATYVSKALPEKYCDVLFTPNFVVARKSEEEGFAIIPAASQATVSLVTAAAPNIGFKDEVKDLDLVYQTVQVIFVAPLLHEPRTECLVLGAWGCGAYGGDPKEMGELFARALKDGFGDVYKEVHFAIPADSDNAAIFRQCLHTAGVVFQEVGG